MSEIAHFRTAKTIASSHTGHPMRDKLSKEEWKKDRRQSFKEFKEEYRAAGGDGEKFIHAADMYVTGIVIGELFRINLIERHGGKYRPVEGAKF